MLLERDLSGVDPDREGAQGELNNALDRLTNNTAADDRASPAAGEFRAVLTTARGDAGTQVAAGPVEDVPRTCARRWPRARSSRKYVTLDEQGIEVPTLLVGQPVRTANGDAGVLPAVPADRRAAHAGPGAEHADRRRADPAAAAGRHRQPRHPAGGAPGPAGRRDRRTVRRRAPRRADAGARRGRGGPARRVVQRDGPEHRGADPQARGVRRAAAPVHLRRQPRAAHPADHRADGRRRAVRVPGRAAAGAAPQLRAAGHRAGPVRGAAGRPAGDQPAGRRGGRPRGRAGRRPGRRRAGRRGGARHRRRDRHRAAAGRPEPGATPRSTRAGWSGSCATWWPTRSTTARGGRCGSSVGCDERTVAVLVRDHGVGLRPGEAELVFNRFWRAEESRARRSGGSGLGLSIAVEDARLHGGWLQAWGELGQRRGVPADAAARGRRHGRGPARCRWVRRQARPGPGELGAGAAHDHAAAGTPRGARAVLVRRE